MDKFIYLIKNNLENEFCQELINKFNSDKNKYPGITSSGFVNKNVKNTTDLILTDDWNIEDNILNSSLNKGLQLYFNHISKKINSTNINIFSKKYKIKDTGYKIQKYNCNEGYYNYHNDFQYTNIGVRVITFIWYLNDIEEGGETEFIDGTIIKPERGSLLLFPSDWTYMHKGNMPLSSDKYICNGWLYLNY